MKSFHLLLLCPLTLALSACTASAPAENTTQTHSDTQTASTQASADTQTQNVNADAWLARLASHCGKAYAGRIISNTPTQPDDTFEGKALVMHVRGCDAPTQRIEVPFHVGDDHSRTWILTRTANGLQLKHDHRHADGTPDVDGTMYGGDTAVSGTVSRQEFPIDAESVALFQRTGRTVSLTNTWAMEVNPNTFVYELSRPADEANPQGRLFRVEFDLTQPVETPPTPWGWE